MRLELKTDQFYKRFEEVKSAIEAKEELQGADIYTDCCTIHVDFSKVSTQIIHSFKKPS
jgi:hypothetical protein